MSLKNYVTLFKRNMRYKTGRKSLQTYVAPLSVRMNVYIVSEEL